MTQPDAHDRSDPLDSLLQEALTARPAPRAPANLASQAIARAQAHEQRLANLQRLTAWMRITSLAAGLIITLTVAAAIYLWPNDTTSTLAASPYTVDGSIIGALDGSTLGIAILIITIAGLAMLRLLTPERPALRFAT